MDSSSRTAIYRVVLGPYDRKIEDNISKADYDLFLFTDTEQVGFSDYQRVMLPTTDLPALKNRELKIKIPKCLRKYELVIYLDANIQICRNFDEVIEEFLGSSSDFGFFRHPYWSIEDEIQSVTANGKAKKELLVRELGELGYLNGRLGRVPLTDNSILFRRNFSRWDNFSEEWYRFVKTYTGRDQISLPFLRERHRLNEHIFFWSPRTVSNKYFVVFPHKFSLKLGLIEYLRNVMLYIKKSFEAYLKRFAGKSLDK